MTPTTPQRVPKTPLLQLLPDTPPQTQIYLLAQAITDLQQEVHDLQALLDFLAQRAMRPGANEAPIPSLRPGATGEDTPRAVETAAAQTAQTTLPEPTEENDKERGKEKKGGKEWSTTAA